MKKGENKRGKKMGDQEVESIRIRPATKYLIDITTGDRISEGYNVGWMDMDKEVKCEECKRYGKWIEYCGMSGDREGETMSFGYPLTMYGGSTIEESRQREQKRRLVIPCVECARGNGFYWGYSYHSRIGRWIPIRCNGMDKSGYEYSDHEIVIESILQKYEEMRYENKIDIKEDAGEIINKVMDIMIIEDRTQMSHSRKFDAWVKRHQMELEMGEYRDSGEYQRNLISYLRYLKDAWVLWSNIHLPEDKERMKETEEIELNLFKKLFIVNTGGRDWVNSFIDGYDEEMREQMRQGYELALELEREEEGEDIKGICREISEIVDGIMEREGEMKEGDYKRIMDGLRDIHNKGE